MSLAGRAKGVVQHAGTRAFPSAAQGCVTAVISLQVALRYSRHDLVSAVGGAEIIAGAV
jgi:hypothetical protein